MLISWHLQYGTVTQLPPSKGHGLASSFVFLLSRWGNKLCESPLMGMAFTHTRGTKTGESPALARKDFPFCQHPHKDLHVASISIHRQRSIVPLFHLLTEGCPAHAVSSRDGHSVPSVQGVCWVASLPAYLSEFGFGTPSDVPYWSASCCPSFIAKRTRSASQLHLFLMLCLGVKLHPPSARRNAP